MAENGRDFTDQTIPTVDKDVRLRNLKDRQNEERQKKLEEIKAQALAAQRFKEQKEIERRRRLEDLKGKEDVRRQQVEERKRAIIQAEQDRLVSILKRNQEREARIEAKKRNERSNVVFAFGSSTPRMLDPTDMTSSFWGHRRATSIQNITCTTSASLTRRPSERDLDGGSKKRATSASGLDRGSGESNTPSTPAGCASGYVGRRRTDLMPTIPSRDSPFTASRKSLNQSPGRAYSMSRLDQLAKPRKRPELPALAETASFSFRPISSSRQSSITRSMSHLTVSKTGPGGQLQNRKPLNKSNSRSMHQLSLDGPSLMPRTTRATQLRQQKLLASSNCSEVSSRPSSSLSQQSTTSVTSSVSLRHRPTVSRRPRPASIATTGITHDIKHEIRKGEPKPPLPKTRKPINRDKSTKCSKTSSGDGTPNSLASPVLAVNFSSILTESNPQTDPVNSAQNSDTENVEEKIKHAVKETKVSIDTLAATEAEISEVCNEAMEYLKVRNLNSLEEPLNPSQPPVEQPESIHLVDTKPTEDLNQTTFNVCVPVFENRDEMTTSVAKIRINTEEEAKAALAERRRLAREEAERQAEQERLRIEQEREAELEKQRKEEEQVRLLIEQQRIAEQERLEEAIKETQRKDEEERLRKEEEQRSKILKEEAEKRARVEAEKKSAEQQERLKNEEKEREARRKRVEAIMRRTRGMNNVNAPSQQNSEDKNENKSENKLNGTKKVEQEHSTKNGKDVHLVDNIIPDETMKNANTMSIDTISSTDSINSNNTWQTTPQYDSLM